MICSITKFLCFGHDISLDTSDKAIHSPGPREEEGREVRYCLSWCPPLRKTSDDRMGNTSQTIIERVCTGELVDLSCGPFWVPFFEARATRSGIIVCHLTVVWRI